MTGLPLLLLAAGTATRMLRAIPIRMLIQDSSRMPAFATMGDPAGYSLFLDRGPLAIRFATDTLIPDWRPFTC